MLDATPFDAAPLQFCLAGFQERVDHWSTPLRVGLSRISANLSCSASVILDQRELSPQPCALRLAGQFSVFVPAKIASSRKRALKISAAPTARRRMRKAS